MAEELQQLLEKIQRDGVEKANAEAKTILTKAKAEAEALVKDAQTQAEALRAQAQKDADAFVERAGKTISQSARDTMLEVKRGVEQLLNSLLAKDVNAALADTGKTAEFVLGTLRELSAAQADVAAGPQLAEALRAQLAAQAVKGVQVVVDNAVGNGFSVRLDGGRVEHDFSESAITAAISRHLRPDLAKLVQG